MISITSLHCRQTKTFPVSICFHYHYYFVFVEKTIPTHPIVPPRLRTTSICFNSADAGMPQPPTKARGNNRLPGIMTLGYIAAFGNPTKERIPNVGFSCLFSCLFSFMWFFMCFFPCVSFCPLGWFFYSEGFRNFQGEGNGRHDAGSYYPIGNVKIESIPTDWHHG